MKNENSVSKCCGAPMFWAEGLFPTCHKCRESAEPTSPDNTVEEDWEKCFDSFWNEVPAPTKWGEKVQIKDFIRTTLAQDREKLLRELKYLLRHNAVAYDKVADFAEQKGISLTENTQ